MTAVAVGGFVVPRFVAQHRDPVVGQAIHITRRYYERRWALRADLRDRHGDLLLPAWPELLARLPKRGQDESGEDFERRRSDAMQAICAVLLVLIGCCDWSTMEIKDPRGGYLSVARLAELAELPFVAAPSDDGRRPRAIEAGDRTERALATLRHAGLIAYTKQWRERLPDGRHVATGPALRKVAVGWFKKVGGSLLEFFDRRRAKAKNKRERAAEKDWSNGRGADLRRARLVRGMLRTDPRFTPAAATSAGGPTTPIEDIDAVRAEHPEWTFAEIIAEARRRNSAPPVPARIAAPPLELITAIRAEHPEWTFAEITAEARRRGARDGPDTS